MLKNLFTSPENNKRIQQQKEYPDWLAYEPKLIPPPALMQTEGIHVLEEWFRWAEEWSVLLRVYGGVHASSRILEIGCGLGRIAFALRYLLSKGSYHGFEIVKEKIEFLQDFHHSHPNFKFRWADVHNTYYNPKGKQKASHYKFEYKNATFDTVFAASVFTHMLPEAALNYFRETARVLKPGGKAVFSFFLLDYYQPGKIRPYGFSRSSFNFDYTFPLYDNSFAYSNPQNHEEMTAYRIDLIKNFLSETGLELDGAPVPGLWSGTNKSGVCSQDLLIIRKPE